MRRYLPNAPENSQRNAPRAPPIRQKDNNYNGKNFLVKPVHPLLQLIDRFSDLGQNFVKAGLTRVVERATALVGVSV
jgi:hypothetical protein